MDGRATRRRFLAALSGAGVGAGLLPASGQAATGDGAQATEASVAFYGSHQAGIATPSQACVHFLALDVVSASAGDLRSLLKTLSHAAASIAHGRPVGALATGLQPPVDTGEAIGRSTARTTVTLGLGPAIFAPRRFGLAAKRPAPLVHLPSFPGDALVPGWTGGDVGLQVCSDDPQVAFHAVHDLIRLAAPTAVPRWSLAGFGNTANSRRQATPRNLMGFKDGTNNIKVEDVTSLDEFVWAGAPESPAWMRGGSYLVLRRIAMLFGHWDEISLTAQERTFGRHKGSGAPLGGVHEHDRVELSARTHGQLRIPADAHIRLASPSYNAGQQLLRRGYNYTDGIDHDGAAVSGGLLFICYQRDPRKQFIPIQSQLAADALSQHIEPRGSAVFACPPGARRGGFVGEGLFG
jgi:deferrochelatase/peroxidase EfeB